MSTPICQSCEMPMDTENLYGTEADGSLTSRYCMYCYENGSLAAFCQSCGMPMKDENDFGTEADNSANSEYCGYCYKDGKFTADVTMEEMIDLCAKMDFVMIDDQGNPMGYDDKVAAMRQGFPTLKRWS